MVSRQNISSGGKYEKVIGYSRVLRFRNMIFVSGTTGTDSTGSLTPNADSYAQARQAWLNILAALQKAGATLDDVVRTKVFSERKSQLAGCWKSASRILCIYDAGFKHA